MSYVPEIVLAEAEKLKSRYPDKDNITLKEYADYLGIKRTYAAEHFRRMNSGENKIPHIKIGQKLLISFEDFAYWILQYKRIGNSPVQLPQLGVDGKYKRTRGYTFN